MRRGQFSEGSGDPGIRVGWLFNQLRAHQGVFIGQALKYGEWWQRRGVLGMDYVS